MKSFLGIFLGMLVSGAAFAADPCQSYDKPLGECLLKDLIANHTNAEIEARVNRLTALGLHATGEMETLQMSASCHDVGQCYRQDLVSARYSNGTSRVETVLVQIAVDDDHHSAKFVSVIWQK